MAVVLTSEEPGYFSPPTIRRSHSQTHFGTASSTSTTYSPELTDGFGDLSKTYSRSAPSSAASSPRLPHAGSTDLSSSSTPASNFSLASEYDADDDTNDNGGLLPHQLSDHNQSSTLPVSMAKAGGLPSPTDDATLDPLHLSLTPDLDTPSHTPSSPDYPSSDGTPKPDTPEFPDHAEDDSAVSTRPSRQVDYLSHEWREEDIWTSWRYITTRRSEYANSARLENASWRTWMKSKNKLTTVSPETLNWLKDCDVTWLYGPLQPGPNHMSPARSAVGSSALSKTNSAVNLSSKKPILKKRSTSEVMLQRSLSTASLLKQAAAAVQAQETTQGRMRRPILVRAATDHTAYTMTSGMVSRDNTNSLDVSTGSSSITSPSAERKHIHFNEQVSQCIAVDVKGEGDDEDEDDVDADPMGNNNNSDDSSDDGVVMMRTRSRRRAPVARRRKREPSKEGRTIAMLPSTTLKYREDIPEITDTAMKHSTGRSPLGSPSSSQETLRPSRKGGFFFDDDDDDEDEVLDGFCAPDDKWRSPPPELDTATAAGGGGLNRPGSSDSLTDEPTTGMHRTPSGMLMPYGEAEAAARDGIFGRVVDTVNTARDIAHVIWNVGWRK